MILQVELLGMRLGANCGALRGQGGLRAVRLYKSLRARISIKKSIMAKKY